ncbi:hypothetical protein DGG96_11410 [Legionella qingyii]|uniref:Uncharacterized protein n=1 Tax=Legionella qingyii TaxID=2184757 RepID=A0A317TY74_9GAMM|nr:hypothetical protein [Legionella qingyii]PWY54573.1 hypothetical protein DGG96_16320 [Legionella qingyii]PWY55527.1 hypothetical protein DGG96_11410 [Legionella qingyii]RUR21464.1 hypothetical protein ELY20_12215 [Legionella qingyii]RUR24717.1 hypothetical protein ELY16_11105 [Legionella qingyii]
MYSYLKIIFLVLIVFVVGVMAGVHFHPSIHEYMEKIWNKFTQEKVAEEVHFCPPPNIVQKHQYDPEAFQVEKLYWQMEYQGWKAPENIGFMQALINSNNNLVCYYQWPSPKDKGTYLWMTIHLSPSVHQSVKPYGPYWSIQKKEKQARCNSGINACGIILLESTQ